MHKPYTLMILLMMLSMLFKALLCFHKFFNQHLSKCCLDQLFKVMFWDREPGTEFWYFILILCPSNYTQVLGLFLGVCVACNGTMRSQHGHLLPESVLALCKLFVCYFALFLQLKLLLLLYVTPTLIQNYVNCHKSI